MPQAMPARPSAIFAQGKRRRMNLVAICVNIFMPWLVFSALYAILSFSFHYQHPTAAWLIWCLGVLGVIISAAMAYRARKHEKEAMWFNFSTLGLLVAVSSPEFSAI
jgi:hypothetical protein